MRRFLSEVEGALVADVAARAVKRHQERYADFGPTLACEKLASEHDLTISPGTLTAPLPFDCAQGEELRRIDDVAGANALLEASFLADRNRRFAVKPASSVDLHRPVAADVCLADVLGVADERVVRNDWRVRWHNRWLRVDARHASLQLLKRRVTVRERADGSVVLDHAGEPLEFAELRARPEPAPKPKRPVVNNRPHVPRPNHPWKARRACD